MITIVSLTWPVFIDSGYPFSQLGRYDILSANPFETLRFDVNKHTGNPFQDLKKALGEQSELSELPFCGGAIGYFGYDLSEEIWVTIDGALFFCPGHSGV